MSPDPTLPASVEAVRELPEEIARAIEALLAWRHRLSQSAGGPAIWRERHDAARAALDAAILSRLTAAEASRDAAIQERDALNLHIEDITEARTDAMRMVQYLSQEKKAAFARVERLEKALRWYVENDDVNLSDPENQFWIDGYNQARAVLSSPTATEEG